MKNRFGDNLHYRLAGLFLLGIISGAAAVTVDDFVARVFTNADGTMPYRLFVPTNYTATNKYPIVLYLHGADGNGTDNRKQLPDGVGAFVFVETNQLNNPSFMVAPQCPSGMTWSNDRRARLWVLGIMNALISEFSIDTNRLYITGCSMGGQGVWDYTFHYPTMYAAAVPMSGATTTSYWPSNFVDLPIWCFHATNDNVVNVFYSQRMIRDIRRAGGSPIYSEFETGWHGIFYDVYHYTPNLMQWIYAHSRGQVYTNLPPPPAPPIPNGPLLNITSPTQEPIYNSAVATLDLVGTAENWLQYVDLVTWTNYQNQNRVSGTAAVKWTTTLEWSATNLLLDVNVTNFILVTGRIPNGHTWMGGYTTFNDALTVIFPPFIVQQPQAVTTNEGAAVSLQVVAGPDGSTPKYQWQFNGTNLLGQTNFILTLNPVQMIDTGNFSVQVSNIFGSIVSSNALVVVIPRPLLRVWCENESGQPALRLAVSNLIVSHTYTLQITTNFIHWSDITNFTSPPAAVVFTNLIEESPARFFRIRY